MATVDLPQLLQVLNVLILPALYFVVRIDRRVGQLDTLQEIEGRQLDELQRDARELDIRLTRLECK
jgi:hypothetical protein